ncbi:MAG: hypothetical protein KUA35_09240 [Pseudodesulfovibrio sp.]|uniref:Uncharacterized protein n=1 Tax=Pseudodesulfovibrio aespoeensis (strain ATCC 700646 / DSM 10631 / Aspo-2) TaxID=643562 RepID=E6VX41_PSEA9|nr:MULTISPECIES: phage regulatory CII family protein [Pseudodesulfovibrio]MBU4378875.1 hypothetical protein [Pseudomonadota bacterium]MCG2742000.1 hypothetical protein [Syntrophaceae bacterium]ADU61447.1 hypothetical protein Daes_0423 [Pseudodesulfovibrio aespoeensis Aspo-2]MBU4475253.1 hypothetical protein [Pseudomonadota bacterium]MBU4516291.1 hypothetical protein [Pseudomonadota bacterium]
METKLDTQALAGMDAVDAFKVAIMKSSKELPAVAREMGWSDSHTRRIFSTDRYFPSFEDIPKFCHVVGNTLVVQWLQAKAMTYGLPQDVRNLDCENLVWKIGELFAEVGDVGRKGQEAIADGQLEAHELREIINEVKDVLTAGMELVGDLRVLERELSKK